MAELLRSRTESHDTSDFTSGTAYHVCDVIEMGGATNPLFRSYVGKPLRAVRRQFGLKYWPSLADFVQALGADAESAQVLATNQMTAAATEGQRNSLASFVKALYVAIDEIKQENFGPLPRNFALTDKTMAILINCVLGRR